jgi:polyisoprenoid-binding protein YceI
MLKRVLVLTALVFAITAAAQADTWNIDPVHSTLGFTVKHMVITKVSGEFKDFTGTIDFDGKDVGGGKVELTAQSKSITTNNDKRDGHLRSPDFFAVDSFPTVTFKSKKITKGEGNNFKLTGDLTLRGVTKEVTLDCVFNGTVAAWGDTRASFSATTTINRQDFGVNWSKTLDGGGLVVSNEVVLNIELEAVKAKT